ncbi:DUF21-domain-containing protein [Cutaneotrichosporon oleaginosum]|uniref:DUF21-domain-containing protein n=1 Tax=Cutaneotrichosporon oleaginosum TaxID=879819 RepID=A0A0J1B2U8_9TREE|nr:DUF21-domain-containing protein [Cutaneotrichosporon oleaginosum]KLT41909.1 DUF21-domain-containing protein [Cutaneotrichosporon oleaginosum]
MDVSHDTALAIMHTTLNSTLSVTKHVHVTPSDPRFVWYILTAVALVLLGGIFSGLTLGLMGLDTINLQVLSQVGTLEEQEQAPRVLNLLKIGRHLVLVVLLLCNTLINTSLPVFLDSVIGGGWIAILGATALELIFGEVIPQAICNKYGLTIGASFAPFVRGLVFLLYPIAKPMAMILDCLFGKHDEGVRYRKAELKAFVSLGVEDKLADDELLLLGNVLEFSGKTVGTIMILRKGHTRIPVFEAARPGLFIGVLLLRALVGYDLVEKRTVRSLTTQALPQCPPDLSLVEAMNYFQTGVSHILLISTHPGESRGALGIVTLEDIVEELLGREIIVRDPRNGAELWSQGTNAKDETDRFVDMQSRIPVIRPRFPIDHSGVRRIFEGRFNRRRAFVLASSVPAGYHTSAVEFSETAATTNTSGPVRPVPP